MKKINSNKTAGRLGMLFCLLIASVAVLVPSVASAHETVVAKQPGAKAKTKLKQASITLNTPIRGGSLKVFGPKGKASKGSGGRDPRNFSRLRAVMKRGLAPGRYTAKAVWTAADGHRQRYSFTFRLVR